MARAFPFWPYPCCSCTGQLPAVSFCAFLPEGLLWAQAAPAWKGWSTRQLTTPFNQWLADRRWYINTLISSCYGQGSSEVHALHLHWLKKLLSGGKSQLFTMEIWSLTHYWLLLPSLSHFLTHLLLFPSITSKISYFHSLSLGLPLGKPKPRQWRNKAGPLTALFALLLAGVIYVFPLNYNYYVKRPFASLTLTPRIQRNFYNSVIENNLTIILLNSWPLHSTFMWNTILRAFWYIILTNLLLATNL